MLAIDAPGPDLTAGPSPSLAIVAGLARRHGVSVIAGSIPERGANGRHYNTATVIDRQGRLRAKYRKLHLFDVDVPGGTRFCESDSLSDGSQATVLSGAGDPPGTGLAQPPNLGLLIGYDIRCPERALLLQQRHGCSPLACSSARPLAADGYPSYGHSLVVDPWGTVIAEAGIGEQVLHADLDWAAVAHARQAIPTRIQRRPDVVRLGPA